MLFSEREAEFVAQVPVKPFTPQQAATNWKIDVTEARKVLEGLAELEQIALKHGFDGLRASGNASWLTKEQGQLC
jgi:hypothetical protein